MEHVASILGLELPMGSARKTIMKSLPRRARVVKEGEEGCCSTSVPPIPSVLLELPLSASLAQKNKLVSASTAGTSSEDEDNLTLETYNSELDETSVSSSSTAVVSFVEPIVTQVYYRPKLAPCEKQAMFYSEQDYVAFRNDFFRQRSLRQQRRRTVQFSREVVSEVFVYQTSAEKDALFYSETDLQRYVVSGDCYHPT